MKGFVKSRFLFYSQDKSVLDFDNSEQRLHLENVFTKVGLDYYTMYKTHELRDVINVEPDVVFTYSNHDESDISVKHLIQIPTSMSIDDEKSLYKFISKHRDELISIRNNSFVNFHHHNQFSIRDGYGTEEQIAKRLVELKSPGFCLTNHGNINAHWAQYKESNKYGIKPIFGTEFYFNPFRKQIIDLLNESNDTLNDKNFKKFIKDNEIDDSTEESLKKALGKQTYHVTVIAKNKQGYYDLIKANNIAHMESFYRFPLIDFDILSSMVGNVVVFSGCPAGYIPRNLSRGNDDVAVKEAIKYKKTFNDDFYIELMSTNYDKQKDINNSLINLSKVLDVKCVITNDAHYVKPSDAKLHELLMLSSNKNTYEDLNDPNKKKKVWTFEQTDYYIKDIHDLKENTNVISDDEKEAEKIIDECINNVNDIFVEKIKPFVIDTSIKLPKIADDPKKLFLDSVKEGLKNRKMKVTNAVQERLHHEIEVIINSGFIDYFNILHDIISWTKKNYGKYSVGYGRGSAASSLVNYLLGITNVNPMKYPMMVFERFLDPARPDPPDVDVDLATNIRPKVIEYIINKYGENRVMSIGTHSKNQLKSSIADVFRTLNVPFGEVIAVTKKLDDDDDMDVAQFMDSNVELKNLINKYPESFELIEGIRGQLRNMGQHPGGVCISGVDIKENLPVYRTNKQTFATANTEGVEVRELSEMGYIKYDMLGLMTLQLVNETNALIERNYGRHIEWNEMDEKSDEYSKIYEIARIGDTYGIFQLTTSFATKVTKDIRPQKLEDINAISALLRPGPYYMGMHMQYARRLHGEEVYEVNPAMEKILGPTYGVLVYQEQVMQLAELAGFSRKDANILRKVLVKIVDLEKVEQFHKGFVEGIQKYISHDEAERLWQLIFNFTKYSFNYSHSLSYAINSFQQLYQKYYYAIEFYTVLFNNYEIDKLPDILSAIISFPARKFDENGNVTEKYHIKLNPPILKLMNKNFEIAEDGKSINYGLSKIKYMSEASFETLKSHLSVEELDDPYTFLKKTYTVKNKSGKDTQKKVFDKKVFLAMLYSGALDYLNMPYEELIEIYDKKLLDSIHYDNKKKLQEEQINYIGFSKEKYETEIAIFNQVRQMFPEGLEYIFDEEVKECNSAVDYVKVVSVTNKKTKGGKPFKNIKVSCLGRNYSPIFIWDQTINPKTGDEFVGFFKKGNGWVTLYNKVMLEEV